MKRSLRSWIWRVPVDQEVDEEIGFHIEMRTRELIDRGADPTTAREEAIKRAGDLRRLARRCIELGKKRDRHMQRAQYVHEFLDDLGFAGRQLRRSPAFTLVAAVTLALGIGANSAMFALADATLLRPLPYPNPDRLAIVWGQDGNSRTAVDVLDFRDFRQQNHTFERMAAVRLGAGGGPLLAAPDGTVESVDRQTVSTAFFDVLGVTPVAGRTFLASDEGPRASVVVLSEGLWRTRFGGDSAVVGATIRLNGEPHTVIGVVPDDVQWTRHASIWTLAPQVPATFAQRGQRMLQVVGRVKPGVALEEAQADLSVIAERLGRDFPKSNQNIGVTVEPFRVGLIGRDLRLTSMFLVGVVGVVLLMCCANVANLLLARANVRTRELAVRSALGAGRARIVRLLLTESLVLAVLGGGLGIAVGAAVLQVAPSLIPVGLLPAAVKLTFDARVVAFCAVSTLAVGVVFGLIPAWLATKKPLAQTIASEGRISTRGGGRLRNLLASGEVAAAALLLCGAGLLLRTVLVFSSFETGYQADGDAVLTLDFTVQGSRYSTPEAFLQFYDAVERDVRALPLIESAGWASSLPWGTTEFGRLPFEIVGSVPVEPGNRQFADFAPATPGYFHTLSIPIVAGREFSAADTGQSTPVCIVNEAFVRRHLQGRNPIGTRVAIRSSVFKAPPSGREIVGIARQVPGRPDDPNELAQVYVPLTQAASGDTFLVVRSAAGKPEALVPGIRAIVARHDANVPVRRIRTLDDLAGEATARYRFRAVLVTTFAALALLLALVGVFGVLAYSVQQRWREFGVRVALGATPAGVLALVLRGAVRAIAVGAAVGLAGAALLSKSISTFLYGVTPLDPVTFGSVGLIVAATAAVAIAAPALRAAHIDPILALRKE
jgi:putative ABC transport system permease protein